MSDLDRASLDRLLPATPGAPDWDDVMGRSAAFQSHRHRRLVALAATALVVAIGTAAAIGSVRDFILDRGFIGLPPSGATPSAPESGELVVHWEGFTPTLPPPGTSSPGPLPGGTRRPEPRETIVPGPPTPRAEDIVRAWVYADGRVIWDRRRHHQGLGTGIAEGANEFNSGYLEQRLTPEGVELVRSAVAGLFERSRSVLETVPADDGVPLLGSPGRLALFVPEDFPELGRMGVPDGDRLVRLQWERIGGNAKEVEWRRKHLQGTNATPEQLSALRRIDALVTDPALVLPPSAWAVREVRAYVPSHYAVCIDTSPPKDASHLLSLLPARAADLLRDQSRTRSDGEVVEAPNVVLGQSVRYCFKVETEQAREVAEALSGLDPEPGWKGFALAYRVAEPVDKLNPTWIWFEPYFPHGQFTFSGPFG